MFGVLHTLDLCLTSHPNDYYYYLQDKSEGLEPRREYLDHMSTLSNQSDFRSHLVLPPAGQVAHVGEGINFYLRLGCLGQSGYSFVCSCGTVLVFFHIIASFTRW